MFMKIKVNDCHFSLLHYEDAINWSDGEMVKIDEKEFCGGEKKKHNRSEEPPFYKKGFNLVKLG